MNAIAARLADGFAAAERAFAEDDAVRALAALDAVVAACDAVERGRVRLDDDALRGACQGLERCGAAAISAQERLHVRLEAAGAARRADAAYRAR